MDSFEDILRFWFPAEMPDDPARVVERIEWWFRGGADAMIVERFVPLLERAARDDLDDWAGAARSRLALIIVLDQFSRSAFRGTVRAFAQDRKALALTREGIEIGDYESLNSPWEKMFFMMPLSHSEDLANHDRAVGLMQGLVDEAPASLRGTWEFSLSQARGHRDVIARFGRHPHRNAVLGRRSTPEELAHLAAEGPVHERAVRS